jgi:hypothetical protein
MRIFPVLVIPIHRLPAEPVVTGCANQVRFFDVFYTHPLVVGMQIMGQGDEPCPVLGVSVLDTTPECGVGGFSVVSPQDNCGVTGFAVQGDKPPCIGG